MKNGGPENQLLVSASDIPGLNSKSLHSIYVGKKCILLIAIRPFEGDVKSGGPFGTFDKSRLMPVPGFSFPFSSPHIYLLIHYSTLLYFQILNTLKYGQLKWYRNTK